MIRVFRRRCAVLLLKKINSIETFDLQVFHADIFHHFIVYVDKVGHFSTSKGQKASNKLLYISFFQQNINAIFGCHFCRNDQRGLGRVYPQETQPYTCLLTKWLPCLEDLYCHLLSEIIYSLYAKVSVLPFHVQNLILQTIKRKGSGNTNSYLPILSVGGFALTSTSIDDNNGDDSNSDDEIEFSEGLKRKHSGIFYSSLVFSFVNRTMAEPIWSETHCYFILRLRYMAHAIPSLLLNIIRKHTSKEIGLVSYDYIKP